MKWGEVLVRGSTYMYLKSSDFICFSHLTISLDLIFIDKYKSFPIG